MGKYKTHEEFIREMKTKQPNIEVLGQYIHGKSSVYCKCKICGFDRYPNGKPWEPTPNNLLHKNPTGCPQCSGNVKTHKKFIQEMNEKRPDINVLGIYKNYHSGVHCQCKICGFNKYQDGTLWNPLPSNILKGMGCPNCNNDNKTSFAEQAILFYCNKFTTAVNRYTKFGVEIDVWLPELNVGIEYNGMYWHDKRRQRDQIKLDVLKKNNIRMITIQDNGENTINGDVITHSGCGKKFNEIDWAIKQLLILLRISDVEIKTEQDEHDIYAQYASLKKENSFEFNYPDKAKEWDYEKNGNVTPDMVSRQSSRKFFRICPLCNTSYKTALVNWIKRDGCHMCAGERQRGSNNPVAKSVLMFDTDGVLHKQFECGRDVAKYLGISISSASRRCIDHKPLEFGACLGYTLWYAIDYKC